jgi:hypothetical protein
LVWGGSWAIRREMFEGLEVREAWKATLSDDLVVSRIMKRHRLRVLFQPPCMVASPLDHDLRSMFSFLRRQYLIGRFYVPDLWLAGISLGATTLMVLVSSLALAIAAAFAKTLPIWIPAGVFLAYYGLNALRAWIRQSLVHCYFPSLAPRLRRARWFDIWAGPLIGLVNMAGLIGAMFGREFTWRGIRYRLLGGGHVAAVWHQNQPAGAAARDQVFVLDCSAMQGDQWKRAG